MDFSTSVKTCLFQKYVTFSGRATRSEFWFFYLFVSVPTIGLSIIFGTQADSMPWIINALLTIFNLAVFLPFLSVTVRRLHDIGKSGWWQLIILVPLIGVILLIVWLVTKSEAADNRFGPTPNKNQGPDPVSHSAKINLTKQ